MRFDWAWIFGRTSWTRVATLQSTSTGGSHKLQSHTSYLWVDRLAILSWKDPGAAWGQSWGWRDQGNGEAWTECWRSSFLWVWKRSLQEDKSVEVEQESDSNQRERIPNHQLRSHFNLQWPRECRSQVKVPSAGTGRRSRSVLRHRLVIRGKGESSPNIVESTDPWVCTRCGEFWSKTSPGSLVYFLLIRSGCCEEVWWWVDPEMRFRSSY